MAWLSDNLRWLADPRSEEERRAEREGRDWLAREERRLRWQADRIVRRGGEDASEAELQRRVRKLLEVRDRWQGGGYGVEGS